MSRGEMIRVFLSGMSTVEHASQHYRFLRLFLCEVRDKGRCFLYDTKEQPGHPGLINKALIAYTKGLCSTKTTAEWNKKDYKEELYMNNQPYPPDPNYREGYPGTPDADTVQSVSNNAANAHRQHENYVDP